jgi:senataxin
MDNFWTTFDSWDVEQMLKSLEHFGTPSANSNPVVQTLSDIPSPLVLRMMSNWAIFSDPRIQNIIRSIPPRAVFQDWPSASVPPGVLVLLVEQTSALRQWASSQMSHYPSGPTAVDNFTESHMKALEALTYGLTSRDSSGPSSGPFSFLDFVQDSSEVWAGLNSALRFVPVEYLKQSSRCKVDIRKLVSRHLSETEIRAFFVFCQCILA